MREKTPAQYIKRYPQWQNILNILHQLLTESQLTPTIKWGAPVYTLDNKNIIGIGAFKTYCGLWFFQGALLKDTANKLINAQQGKTKAMRQWRFYSIDEVEESLIKCYINEATDLAMKGQYIKPTILDNTKPIALPSLLQHAVTDDQALLKAFRQLTPGKQKEYTQYIQDAKRETTQQTRLEKIVPMIKQGVGLNDRYRSKK